MTPAFEPYVPDGFELLERRTLIVGETHYGAPAGPAPGFTREVVEYWQEQIEAMRFFDNVAALLRPDGAPQSGREMDAVAFYNFVQQSMKTADERPTREQLVASASFFPEVMERLAPTHILVAGKTQWSYLPPFDVDLGKPVVGGKTVEMGLYTTPRGPAIATVIPHPSWRYFTAAAWRDVVQAFLALDPGTAHPLVAVGRKTSLGPSAPVR